MGMESREHKDYRHFGGAYNSPSSGFVRYENQVDEDGNVMGGSAHADGFGITWKDLSVEEGYQYGTEPADLLNVIAIRLRFIEDNPDSADDRRADALALIEQATRLLTDIHENPD